MKTETLNKRWMYVAPSGTTYGPLYAKNEKDVRAFLRRSWKMKTTRGYYFYEETSEEAEKKIHQMQKDYEPILKANSHLTLTDFM